MHPTDNRYVKRVLKITQVNQIRDINRFKGLNDMYGVNDIWTYYIHYFGYDAYQILN